MMRRISVISVLIVSASVLFGCTMLPASQETGIGPGEYAEIKNSGEIKKENESLKEEIGNLKSEIDKKDRDYLELAKNNEAVISKLQDVEAKLNILDNEGIPDFSSEKTDKNDIMSYLDSSRTMLDRSLRGIEILESYSDSSILFYTTGYGDSFNQIFLWSVGSTEPELVNGAAFAKSGYLERINDRFIMIITGNEGERKMLDIEKKSIISSFYSKQKPYLIADTSSFIMQKPDTGAFILYDFVNAREQEIALDYNNKYSSFEVDEESGRVIFAGIHKDEYETEYRVEAAANLSKMKKKYNILSLEEAIVNKGGASAVEDENGADSAENIELVEGTNNEV